MSRRGSRGGIHQVILAGGMAANAKVQALVATLMEGKPIKVDSFPDESAAAGAAIEGPCCRPWRRM